MQDNPFSVGEEVYILDKIEIFKAKVTLTNFDALYFLDPLIPERYPNFARYHSVFCTEIEALKELENRAKNTVKDCELNLIEAKEVLINTQRRLRKQELGLEEGDMIWVAGMSSFNRGVFLSYREDKCNYMGISEWCKDEELCASLKDVFLTKKECLERSLWLTCEYLHEGPEKTEYIKSLTKLLKEYETQV